MINIVDILYIQKTLKHINKEINCVELQEYIHDINISFTTYT